MTATDRILERLVARQMANHLELSVRIVATAILPLNLFIMICEQVLANPLNRGILLAARLALTAAGFGYFGLMRWRPRVAAYYLAFVPLLCNLAFIAPVANLAAAGQLMTTPASTPVFVGQAMTIILLIPANRVTRCAVAVLQYAAFVGATWTWYDQLSGVYALMLGAFFMAAAVGDAILALAKKAARDQAAAELDLNPSGLVDGGRRDVACVMLASDWRGYQALTAGVEPSAIAGVLARYYDIVTGLLPRHLGETPYIMDWIADELLICVPCADDAARDAAAQALVAFAQELIVEKTGISLGKDRVPAIDFGVALGRGTLGLFGPDGRQKISLVGPALSRARRLQTVGKTLRATAGAMDRIICDAAVYAAVPNAPQDRRLHRYEDAAAEAGKQAA